VLVQQLFLKKTRRESDDSSAILGAISSDGPPPG